MFTDLETNSVAQQLELFVEPGPYLESFPYDMSNHVLPMSPSEIDAHPDSERIRATIDVALGAEADRFEHMCHRVTEKVREHYDSDGTPYWLSRACNDLSDALNE